MSKADKLIPAEQLPTWKEIKTDNPTLATQLQEVDKIKDTLKQLVNSFLNATNRAQKTKILNEIIQLVKWINNNDKIEFIKETAKAIWLDILQNEESEILKKKIIFFTMVLEMVQAQDYPTDYENRLVSIRFRQFILDGSLSEINWELVKNYWITILPRFVIIFDPEAEEEKLFFEGETWHPDDFMSKTLKKNYSQNLRLFIKNFWVEKEESEKQKAFESIMNMLESVWDDIENIKKYFRTICEDMHFVYEWWLDTDSVIYEDLKESRIILLNMILNYFVKYLSPEEKKILKDYLKSFVHNRVKDKIDFLKA